MNAPNARWDYSARAAYPLLYAADDAPFLWHHGRVISGGAVLARAHGLAARLPAHRMMLNLCEDRYEFLLSFLAAQIAGQTCLLPSSRADASLRDLAARHADSYTLVGAQCTYVGPNIVTFESLAGGLPDYSATTIPMIADGHVAAIAFSSGSTGEPTPHVKTWGALWRTGAEIAARFEFAAGAAESIVGAVPPQHMYGLETTIVLPLVTGALLHCGRPLLPADIGQALGEVGGHRWLVATPFTLRTLEQDALFTPRMQAIVSATMPLELELAQAIEAKWKVPLHEIYGCTEGGSLASRRLTRSAQWENLPGVTIARRGEIAWVAEGHLPEPVPLADQIEVASPSMFVLHGRAANVVKVGGKRTSLEALNAALGTVPGVQDGVFFANDPDRDDRPTAFVVAPGRTARDIATGLRDRIDPAFMPRPIVMVDALPRNALGKLTRAALEALAAQRARR
jgi:acyl-coenzyme A synthetase/AMP-(fatty) acid ligase